ncbi:MAG: hypothetical protein WC516_08590 [Patescibacteria group bacterium]|jgi:hypothetical protein
MNEIDEQHELLMRAIDESRELSDIELCVQEDIRYDYLRSEYDARY